MKKQKERSTWQKVRKLFNDLHLWMGLASGVIVIVICFTGTVYVFNAEVREMASPELYTIKSPKGDVLTAEAIISNVEKTIGGKVTALKIPADKNRTWQVSVKKDQEENADGGRADKTTPGKIAGGKDVKRGEDTKVKNDNEPTPDQSKAKSGPGGKPNLGTTYSVNPYTGEVLGDLSVKNSTTEFMRDMFSLHRWLLLDRIEEPIFGELPNRKLGSYITGTATILFTLGVLTGLVIWFPQKIKSWKQGLSVKWSGNWKRINHDLHNTFAFYALIFLFLMGITGPQWSFEWYREGLQKSLGTYKAPDEPRPEPPQSTLPDHAVRKLSVNDYINATQNILAYQGDYNIILAADSTAAVAINKTKVGFFAPVASDKVFVDQYSSAILSTDIFRDKPLNERIAGSIKALHLGDVYGKFTKILYFIACLVATSLPVTGTIIWLNKLKKANKKKAKKLTLKSESAVTVA